VVHNIDQLFPGGVGAGEGGGEKFSGGNFKRHKQRVKYIYRLENLCKIF
jgi:hypothetical protein